MSKISSSGLMPNLCKSKQRFRRKMMENISGYLYVMPVILGILIFTALPVIFAFVTSFFNYSDSDFILRDFGFQNYLKPFQDTFERYLFFQSLKVTFTYAIINIPLTLVLSFAIALVLNQKLRGIKFVRVLFYLPVLIPAVCGGLVWKNIFDTGYGFANALLETLGLPPSTWFTQPETAMSSFIFIGMFGLGGGMILWLAQLKNIPAAMYESAKIDGASGVRQLFQITIPLCTPMIFYNLIMSLIATLQTFTTVQVVTGGSGPSYSLHFYLMNVYSEFSRHNLGYAAALSFILFLIIGVLTMFVFKTSKWVEYGEDY